MTNTYNAMDIANFVINYSAENDNPVCNLKLQKLLYYIQASFLVEKDAPAFDERISAWKYGPVVESVYHEYKKFISNPINFSDLDISTPISDSDAELITSVVDSYEDYTPIHMVSKTHSEEPWDDAYNNKKTHISNKSIKKYYSANEALVYGDDRH